MAHPPVDGGLQFRKLIARLGDPVELNVTQHTDAEGLPFERVRAVWQLPGRCTMAFAGIRYGTLIGDEYADLLKRLSSRT